MSAPASSQAADLDPLALSAETRGRFRMLFLAPLFMTWSLAGVLVPADLSYSGAAEARAKAIMESSLEDLTLKTILERREDSSLSKQEEQHQFRLHLAQLGTAVLLAGSFLVIYTLHRKLSAARTAKRYLTQPLELERFPRLTNELRALAHHANLDVEPQWHIRPGLLDGLAFGTTRKPIVAVAGKAERLENNLGDLHRAVLLHELGHVANQDAPTRESARAAWTALAGLAGLSALILIARGNSWEELALLVSRLSILTLLAVILWAGLVRNREYFADAWVVRWGFGPDLKRRLGFAGSLAPERHGEESQGWLADVRARIKKWRGRWWSFHPSNRSRLRRIDEPRRLFRLSLSLSLATGWLTSLVIGFFGLVIAHIHMLFIYPSLGILTAILGDLHAIPAALLLVMVPLLLLLPIAQAVTRALGTQVLREAVGDLASGHSQRWGYLRQGTAALAFVVGVEIGFWFTPLGLSGTSEAGWWALWVSACTLLIWLWIVQVRGLGRLLLGAQSGTEPVERLETRLRWLTTPILLIAFLPAVAGRVSLHQATSTGELPQPVFGVIPPEAFIAFFKAVTFFLLSLSLLASSLVGFAIFLGVGWKLRGRRVSCSWCGAEWPSRQAVGLSCPGCGRHRAAWLMRPSISSDSETPPSTTSSVKRPS